jgi:hypothetical protein
MNSGLSRLLVGAAVAVMATATPVSAAVIGVMPTVGHVSTNLADGQPSDGPAPILGIGNDGN